MTTPKTTPAPIIRAAIIARTSGTAQKSLSKQLEEAQAECKKRNWTVARIITEDHISGEKYLPRQFAPVGHKRIREEFSDCIDEIKAGTINAIVAFKMERITRAAPEHSTPMLKLFEDCNCQIVLLDESIPGSFKTATGTLQIGMQLLLNNYVSMNAKERVKSGKKHSQMNGLKCSGKAPYGYANETEKATVQKIFRDYASGKPLRTIIHELNETGKSSLGKLWGQSIVKYILTNPIYIGQNKWGVASKVYPAIIPDALFLKCNETLKAGKGMRRGRAKDHLLSGLVKCGKCGNSLHVVATPKRYWRWICKSGLGCNCPNVGEDQLDLLARRTIQNVKVEKVVAKPKEQIEVARIENELAKLKTKLENGLDVETYIEARSVLTAKKSKLEKEIKQTETIKTSTPFSQLPFIEQRRSVVRAISEIVIDAKGAVVKLNNGFQMTVGKSKISEIKFEYVMQGNKRTFFLRDTGLGIVSFDSMNQIVPPSALIPATP